MNRLFAFLVIILSLAKHSFADQLQLLNSALTTSVRPIAEQVKETQPSTIVSDHSTVKPFQDVKSNVITEIHSEMEKDNPPKELNPDPLPQTPVLVRAGAHSLEFLIRIPCEKSMCPTFYSWYYKQTATEEWIRISNTNDKYMNKIGAYDSVSTAENLTKSTSYLVRVYPFLQRESKNIDWFHYSKDSPYSLTVSALTCNDVQDGVRNLTVHSAGRKWLAVSWLPPHDDCTTQLKYEAKLSGELLPPLSAQWRSVGFFWTNATSSVTGDVKQCSLWPNRHCLLLSHQVNPEKKYIIEIIVERIFDGQRSRKEAASGIAHIFPPSPPVDLHCVEMRPTSMQLRWRCPLQPGGEFTHVQVVVEEALTAKVLRNISFAVRLQPEYQLAVGELQPSTLYYVCVWFNNVGHVDGSEACIEVWTPPSKFAPIGALLTQSLRKEVDGAPWWVWLLVVTCLLGLCVLSYFVGRHRSDRMPWQSAKSSINSTTCSSEDGNGPSKRDADLCGEDLEALCIGAGVPSRGTPPSSPKCGYSEPAAFALYTPGRASQRSSLHTYEDPMDLYKEQLYVQSVDAITQPLPSYAEVQRLSPNSTPHYAEVEKKKKLPPLPAVPSPPPPPPTLRFALDGESR